MINSSNMIFLPQTELIFKVITISLKARGLVGSASVDSPPRSELPTHVLNHPLHFA